MWHPAPVAELQWYLDGEISTSNTSEMGTGVTAYNGDKPPATNPTVYDIDGVENTAADVSALHALGAHVVCYIEVGTAGDYYSAADEGLATTYYAQLSAAGDLGSSLSGYPENFLNITSPSTVLIIEAMITQQCAAKGFDGVGETDLDETFGNNEGNTGFNISEAQEESYLETLANFMHGLGLAWFSKDLSDTDEPSFVSTLQPTPRRSSMNRPTSTTRSGSTRSSPPPASLSSMPSTARA